MESSKSRRITKQRLAIIDILEQTSDFVSAQYLHQVLKKSGVDVGLATVYRNLQSLVQERQLDTLHRADGEIVYRRCDTRNHHHHLICISCGKVAEISENNLETWVQEIAHAQGYVPKSHALEIFGTCTSCFE